ncbi:unnamed protein product [Kluyveromyces dobzhanskii CBS 2104]|uniref:WGS project CCBQ000000000 data, contig MAT n=1 Tax=Kluyveromyces dobzhanskii CBS 2104 TaxID=1427455 RepID=A0A0A8L1E1_9SACH|nr:unnamed protein product [Kluyveromyces dobzhanskii CBS 2104]
MKSSAPTFKVTVIKRNRSAKKTSKKIRPAMFKGANSTSGYRKHEGVNLYMSKITPTSIPPPPELLVAYIKEKIKTLDKSEILVFVKNSFQHPTRELKMDRNKKQMNDFIAFRSYYSRLLNGIVTQTELSTIISKHWIVDKQTRKNWELIAQEYNCDTSGIHFYTWLECNYGIDKQWLYEILNSGEREISIVKKPYVENIYNSGYKQVVDSPNGSDVTCQEWGSIADWINDPIFFDNELSMNYFDKSNLLMSDTLQLTNSV